MRQLITPVFLIFLVFNTGFLFAQQYTLSGYLKDKSSGESLIGANIIIKDSYSGTVTNAYGFYSLTLREGEYSIIFSYMGYADVEKNIKLDQNIRLDLELSQETEMIEEVVVTAQSKTENITSTKMSAISIPNKIIKKVPVVMGEADVIKTLKLLPGIQSTGEASSGMSVRGGNRDQNIILLDEANVYSISHMGGMFSVFNNDAIKNVEIYKGNMPPQYGGRLASVVDIRMKEGNLKEFEGTGSIGTISSKLTLEGPIVKDKGSFMVSGRRTYIDLFTKGLGIISDSIPEVPYYFYDLNVKANYAINSNNRIYVSGYFGRDNLDLDAGGNAKIGMNWGNYTGTLRWNSMITNKLFSNITFIASHYDYKIKQQLSLGRDDKEFVFSWDAALKDYTVKADFGYYLNSDNTIKFGLNSTFHDFNIGRVNGKSDSTDFNFSIPKVHSLEHAFYVGNDQKLSSKISLSYGIRFSVFQNIGKATVYNLDDNYEVIDTSYYKSGEIYNTYADGFEPRIGFTYVLSDKNSIKLGYARSRQYMQTASNSISGTPLDVWIPSSEQIKPQISDQYSIGYFHNFFDNTIQASVEVYYKDMKNQVDFKDFADPVLNSKIESELRFGIARAYGIEFLLQKQEGKISGWLSYTYSRSERKIKDIQEKNWFLSPYDTPHDVSLVLTYDITERLSISTNWVYQTGKPFTAPEARVTFPVIATNNPDDEGLVLPYYGGRNNDRLPNYHRMDLGVQFKSKKRENRNVRGVWSLSVYNVYRRANSSAIVFDPDDENPLVTKAYSTSIFPDMLPSVSYTLNF